MERSLRFEAVTHIRISHLASRIPNLAALMLTASTTAAAPPTALHDIHITNARMAVEGKSAFLRIRFFRDDLTHALKEHARRADFLLAATAQSDSVLMEYVQSKLRLRDRGQALIGTMTGSGEEKGVKPELDIWFVDLRFEGKRPVKELEIRNELLFELFPDQRNIIKALLPNKRERTIFFLPGESSYKLKW